MSDSQPLPLMREWLAGELGPDVRRALDRLQQAGDVQYLAVMPDVHLATQVCNGCVLATSEWLYPAAVGGDIGCGMAAIGFACAADRIDHERHAARLLAGLYDKVPINRHSRATVPAALPPALCDLPLSAPGLDKLKPREARFQLGTLGRGNHFLEFQRDEQGRLWLMVHSGSRAMGQAIHVHHAAHALARNGEPAPLPGHEPAGQGYLQDAAWAVQYAAENRRHIVQAVADLMERLFGVGIVEDSFLNCTHNFVRSEMHFGRRWWVHRKGAMSAGEGERGLIPGSMGTESYHVEGRGCAASLCSSSHGAGRVMSRHEARQRISVREVHRSLDGIWFDMRQAAALREEAPAAYKDIRQVMRAQKELTRILRTLTPVLSYKGTEKTRAG